jgi:hypothetical protein
MANTNELEKRLRERLKQALVEHMQTDEDLVEPFALLLTAARIGAELERDECAVLVQAKLDIADHLGDVCDLADAIRARGDRK